MNGGSLVSTLMSPVTSLSDYSYWLIGFPRIRRPPTIASDISSFSRGAGKTGVTGLLEFMIVISILFICGGNGSEKNASQNVVFH